MKSDNNIKKKIESHLIFLMLTYSTSALCVLVIAWNLRFLNLQPRSLYSDIYEITQWCSSIIIFILQQGSCFTYDVMGVVDKPTVADKYYVHADIGGNASIIIPFQNPFYDDVILDIELNENLQPNEGKFIFSSFIKNSLIIHFV